MKKERFMILIPSYREVLMVSLIIGMFRVKALFASVFLILVGWWARKMGGVDVKIERVARPLIFSKKEVKDLQKRSRMR